MGLLKTLNKTHNMELFRTVHDTIASTQIAAIITFHLLSSPVWVLWSSFQNFLIGYAHIINLSTPWETKQGPGLCSETLWSTAIINFPNTLAYCSTVYPWWNTIQLNYLFCAHVSVLQKLCQRNLKICTSIHSRLLKSNDSSSLPENFVFPTLFPIFLVGNFKPSFFFFLEF